MMLERSTSTIHLCHMHCATASLSVQAPNSLLVVDRNDVNTVDCLPSAQLISEEQPACVPDADASDMSERTPCVPTPRHKPSIGIELTTDQNCGAPEAEQIHDAVSLDAVTISLTVRSDENITITDLLSQEPQHVVKFLLSRIILVNYFSLLSYIITEHISGEGYTIIFS